MSELPAKMEEPAAEEEVERKMCDWCLPEGSLKDKLIGNYKWSFLCMPQLPCMTASKPPFFKVEDGMPLLLAIIMGLQHALAMLAGIITVPLVATYSTPFAPTGTPGAPHTLNTPETAQYLVASALICCGLLSIVQIVQIKIPGTSLCIGTGLISVVGTSFVFLPVTENSLKLMTGPGSTDCSGVHEYLNPDGALTDRPCSGREAYGKILGTCMVATLLEIFLSFAPAKILKKIFPPIVSGVCIICIGAGLTGTGFKYWGGGVWCQEHFEERANDCSAPTFGAMQSNGNGFCGPPGCSGNGEIKLPYGSVEYVALGSSCFFMMLFVEMFGNPFMKNCNVVISLLFGYIVACFASLSPEHPKAVGFGFGTGVSCKNGTGFVCPTFNYEDAAGFASLSDLKDGISAGKTACSDACPGFSYTPACSSVPAKFNPCDLDLSGSLDYVTSQKIGLAPMFTFLWAETFPLGFYAPALVPLMIGVLVSTIESIGDINASCDASKLKPPGVSRTGAKPKTDEEYEIEVNSRVQGGLLADGVNSFFAAWMTQLPNTTYSQNNGVIALTNCGSKAAGIACGIWLILFGVFAKVAAIITSIPDCVLGGVTTFLFANVVVSGIRILLDDPDFISGGRRSRAILAISLGLGLGVTMKPGMVEGALSQSFMYGIWPKASECMSFCNTVDGVQTCGGWQNTCVKDDIPWTSTARPDECDYDFGDDTYGYLDAADTCNAAPGCVFVPKVMTWHLWNGVTNCVEWNGMRSFRDGMILILKTPNCIGPLVALLLNLILPVDKDDETAEAVEDGTAETTTPPSA